MAQERVKLKEIICKESLLTQAAALKKKRFRPGFDGMSMEGAAAWIFINGDRLCRDIMAGRYSPMPAVGFRTAKIRGGYRQLARVSAVDTVIQTLLNETLTPFAEERFFDDSFAYRPGRGVHAALERYVALAGDHKYAASIDLVSCFSNIDRDILGQELNSFFEDDALCCLLMSFASTSVFSDGEIVTPEKGILQGMPLAPMLCNIYLHRADEFLHSMGVSFVRYADDLVIFADTLTEIRSYCEKTIGFLEKKLMLPCNKRKLKIDSPVKLNYLGYKFESDKKGITAYEASTASKNAYYSWHSRIAAKDHGRVDLISDGILRQKDYSILFDTDANDTVIPPVGVDTINIFSDVVLDSGFLDLAMKNRISVNVFDKNGSHIGSFLPTERLRSPRTTHEQLMSYYSEEARLYLAKEFLIASIHNTLLNIRYYAKKESKPQYTKAIKKLEKIREQVKQETGYGDLLLLEARAREAYYSCIDELIKKDDFVFGTRTRRPPMSNVNAMMSFGNAVLYSLIATEIQKTPLDVRVGFLHATNTRAESLNLDVAEIFKPLLVDRTIFTLINKGSILPCHFITEENGAVYLTAEGKRIYLQAFYEKLEVTLDIKKIPMSYESIIKEEVRRLVRHFRDSEKYKAFRQVR